MEKLFGIPELMVIIYKNLNFADQLRFAKVNSILRSIFESFIFPVKYTKLKITTLERTEKLLVSDDEDENGMLWTLDEIKNFLLFGAEKVEEIHVISGVLKDTLIRQLVEFLCVEGWVNLRNLTCFHYDQIILCEEDLLLIAENYPKLSELRLYSCINKANEEDEEEDEEEEDEYEEEGECLKVGRGLSISTLARMKNLKSLVVKGSHGPPIGMSLFCELITNVPLECLKFNICLVQDRHDNLISRRFHHHLKELEINFNYESPKIVECTEILKNLVKLNLIMYNATDSDLQTIAKACQNLQCLKFGYRTNFTNTTHFVIPPNLKELSFHSAVSVKSTHVKDILTKFKIEKFTYKSERYLLCLLKDFIMSPYIKVLDLEGMNTIEFPSFYSNNNTLKELHWYEYNDVAENVPDAIQNRECLKTCNNLENLIIHAGHIPLDVIFELKHLQKLKIRGSHEQLNLSYIIGLFQHSSLMELDVNCASNHDATNIPAKGFLSTITLAYLHFGHLEKALNFWLDMLQQNPTMLIKCDIYDVPFLMKLIQHENFPKDLREIKVWGFNLNCKDLRENFWATMEPLARCKQINQGNWPNDALVLSRKQT